MALGGDTDSNHGPGDGEGVSPPPQKSGLPRIEGSIGFRGTMLGVPIIRSIVFWDLY